MLTKLFKLKETKLLKLTQSTETNLHASLKRNLGLAS